MSIDIKVTELPNSVLQFGGTGEFSDPKIGLTEAGPFDLRFGTARKEQIRVGIIGTTTEIRNAKNWIERCKNYVLSGGNQLLHPDFPGFDKTYHSTLENNSNWNIDLSNYGSINKLLKVKDDKSRFTQVLDLYGSSLKALSEMNVIPDVVICCISDDLIKSCGSISKKLSKEEKKSIKDYQKNKKNFQLSLFGEELDNEEEDFLNRDFRRALKARAMHYRLPIQLGTDRLFVDSARSQDPASRAWNFSVALYYKGGGVPWRLKNDGPETCFVGISFHHLQTNKRHLVFSSIAQAFSSKGDGFAIKGESVPWEKEQGKNVHLTHNQAKRLGLQIVNKYKEHTGNLPLRMVLHKTSKFSLEEEEGFYDAFHDIPIVELINLTHTPIRLVQIGAYPPKRGTLCEINNRHFLFTTGFIKDIGTYPGPHIPTPVEILSSKNIDINRAAEEILGLTRMNWNTASITGGQPVTFFFARNVGGIIAEYGEGLDLPSSFKYYM